MRATYCHSSLFATVIVLSAATTVIGSFHSITSSAVTSTVCYTLRPSDFVVVATVVYLLRSVQYQFCNCGVF
jgi:hypothetical protein